MEFRCDLIRENEPTRNGRVYSKECLERVAKQATRMGTRMVHLDDSTCRPESILGIIKECDVKDGYLVADVIFANTKSAKIVQGLMDAGVDFSKSLMPILVGELDSNGNPIPESLGTLGYSLNYQQHVE